MEVQEWPIEKVTPYENNPRVNDQAVEKVAQSIEAYGFQQPIVVDKNGVVIVGHTRLLAAKQLGLKKVPAVVAAGLSDDQVRGYRIADNKTADFSIWDNKKLLEELSEIPEDIFTGFSTSTAFDDVLDEQDNSVLDENEDGVTYQLSYATQDKTQFDRIRAEIEGGGSHAE